MKTPRLTALAVCLAAGLVTSRAALPAQQAYVKASNTGWDDQFGLHVGISADTMVIGAEREDSSATGVNGNQGNDDASDSGAAYVYVRQGGVWTQQAYLKASNTGQGDNFGAAVAISGDTIVIGAPYEASDSRGVNHSGANDDAPVSGAAYVFVRSGTNWTQQAYLKASNSEAGDGFGRAVAISGNTIVVGAWSESSAATGVNGNQDNNDSSQSGAAYVFVRNGSTWSQQAYLKASNTGSGDLFGFAVGISGDTIVVGAFSERSSATGVNGNQGNDDAPNSGAAYVFVRAGTSWSQQAYLKASNAQANDWFAQNVAVEGDTIVVGAALEDSRARRINGNQADNSGNSVGAAYVFARSGTNWNQQAYLKASNAESQDTFGIAVAISGDTVVIGAPTESSSATGTVGNQWDNSAFWAGAAYVFARAGTNWIQQDYLKASNTDGGEPGHTAGDLFGHSVAVSGDTVVVGAYYEQSGATGINGNQTDNTANGAGAAYVFTGLGLGVVPDGLGGYAVRFKETPGLSYGLARAASLSGPWPAIATNVANGLGIVSFHDTNAPSARAFYRTVRP